MEGKIYKDIEIATLSMRDNAGLEKNAQKGLAAKQRNVDLVGAARALHSLLKHFRDFPVTKMKPQAAVDRAWFQQLLKVPPICWRNGANCCCLVQKKLKCLRSSAI